MAHGLTSFNSYFSNKIEDTVYNSETNKFGSLSSEQIFDFERGIYFADIF